jgi:hypothetical protein
MPHELMNDRAFAESSIARGLRAKPLGFVDIGARGGVDALLADVAPLTAVLAFEPDEQACTELQARGTGLPLGEVRCGTSRPVRPRRPAHAAPPRGAHE